MEKVKQLFKILIITSFNLVHAPTHSLKNQPLKQIFKLKNLSKKTKKNMSQENSYEKVDITENRKIKSSIGYNTSNSPQGRKAILLIPKYTHTNITNKNVSHEKTNTNENRRIKSPEYDTPSSREGRKTILLTSEYPHINITNKNVSHEKSYEKMNMTQNRRIKLYNDQRSLIKSNTPNSPQGRKAILLTPQTYMNSDIISPQKTDGTIVNSKNKSTQKENMSSSLQSNTIFETPENQKISNLLNKKNCNINILSENKKYINEQKKFTKNINEISTNEKTKISLQAKPLNELSSDTEENIQSDSSLNKKLFTKKTDKNNLPFKTVSVSRRRLPIRLNYESAKMVLGTLSIHSDDESLKF